MKDEKERRATMISFAKWLAVAVGFVLCGGVGKADLLFSFEFPSAPPIQSFTFSMSTFDDNTAFPAFTPFDVTDGTHVWTFVQDRASPVPFGGRWIAFGTAYPSAYLVPLSTTINPPDGGAFMLNFDWPLAPGTYYSGFFATFFAPDSDDPIIATGTAKLDVTVATPESRTAYPVLLVFVLSILFGKVRGTLRDHASVVRTGSSPRPSC